ncbi:MAG: hypothetical protein ACYTG0_30095 [Planctomycetota bacterium]
MEDRLMLSAAAVNPPENGFIDLAAALTCADESCGGAVFTTDGWDPNLASSPREGRSLYNLMWEEDDSGSGFHHAVGNDVELIRLPPDEPASSEPGEGLIDLTLVLNEPVGFADRQPSYPLERISSVDGHSSGTGSVVASAEDLTASESRGDGQGSEQATLLVRSGVTSGAKAARLRSSPFDQIEGSRGICRAFELASPEQSTATTELQKDREHALPSDSAFRESVTPPYRSGHADPGGPPSRGLAGEASDRWPGSVALGVSTAAHEAALAEMAEPFNDAVFEAVYLDDKRPADVIPLLATAALAHQVARRRHRADAPTSLEPVDKRPV